MPQRYYFCMTSFLISSDIYRNTHYGEKHPLNIPRVGATLDLIKAMSWYDEAKFKTAPIAKPSLLKKFHSNDYVNVLIEVDEKQEIDKNQSNKYNLGTPSNPIFKGMYKRPATSVGGSVVAAEFAFLHGRAFNLGGGLHHGLANKANGFCYLNDLVFAIKRFREFGLRRIAYVDLDAHFCDGVASAFSDDPDVMLVSAHEANRWPFQGKLEENFPDKNLYAPISKGSTDIDLEALFEYIFYPAIENFKPEALIVQGGADMLKDDPLSRLEMTNNCLWKVLSKLALLAPKLLLTSGGGYNPWSVSRLWTGFWAILNDIEPPSLYTDEGRRLIENLRWFRKDKVNPNLLSSLKDEQICYRIKQETLDLIKRMNVIHKSSIRMT
ncbi:MAG: acetoin utilization protein AcuC [Paracoccaceae bacterium]